MDITNGNLATNLRGPMAFGFATAQLLSGTIYYLYTTVRFTIALNHC
jgi:hypothetical protein